MRLLRVVPAREELFSGREAIPAGALAERMVFAVPQPTMTDEQRQYYEEYVTAATDALQREGDRLHAEQVETSSEVLVGPTVPMLVSALTAGDLAAHADFFSFGTNDLTQTTWGISRDDAEASFLALYREQGIIANDPFETLDEAGVGALVREAVAKGRRTKPDLELGVCGEHAGDPTSIGFFAAAGIDYLSCSPPRVPVARLEAGRQAVLTAGAHATSDTR